MNHRAKSTTRSMDAMVKQVASLKSHLKDSGDIVRLGKILGTGPNGEVEELTLRGTPCVGKKLHGFLLDLSSKDSKTTLEKLASDCNQISHLCHPNVAVFFGVCVFDNLQDSSKCLVLLREYAKNDLMHLLEANPCFPLAFKISILLDVTKALDYLHMCKPVIIHRNLSSTNVLITDSLQARVADMECACFYRINQLFDKKRLGFIAPEVLKGNSKVETASDLFSFGHIALHTAVHVLPQELSQGSTELEKRSKYMDILKQPPSIDKILLDLIINCLQDSPKKRPAASTAMRDLKLLEQKLDCMGDQYQSCMRRMTMYEMAEKLVESQKEPDSTTPTVTNNSADERRRSIHFGVSQIKGGVPSLLFLREMIKEGIVIKKQQHKWMEYKFEITADGYLQYSVLNGKILDKLALEEAVHITAQGKVGELFPFNVHFRCNQCWVLGAHNEEERKTWMEAIIPGSTHNQWPDEPFSLSPYQSLKRSATAPSIQRFSDPAYVKYSEINTPSNNPPPVPERPASTIEETTANNTYLTLLPPDTDLEVDQRTEAVKCYTLEQLHLMIDMFEQNAQPTSPTQQEEKTDVEPRVKTRNSPVDVSKHSSKHPSKGLYMSFSEVSNLMEEQIQEDRHTPDHEEQTTQVPDQSLGAKPPSSPRKQGLCRQNAIRCSTTRQQQERKKNQTSGMPKESQSKLRTILRKQSSDDMLDNMSNDNPQWSKAKLGEVAGEVHEVDDYPQESAKINTLSISTKELNELTSISTGHYGHVYKATYAAKHVTVAVKAFQDPLEKTECSEFLHDIAIMAASDHPNIVRMYGFVPENNWIVMEYTSRGDLKNYLRTNRVLSTHLIKYMVDVAMGMHYISARGLVHRNLALRNILIMENDTCKVADLGMRKRSFSVSRLHPVHDLSPHTDQRRWMSPENLTRGHFAEASDIWSFGVIQWEMFQPGRVPYSTLNSSQFPSYIIKGHTLDIPDICPEIVAKIMRACWHWNTTKRPSFMYIASLLIKRTLGEED